MAYWGPRIDEAVILAEDLVAADLAGDATVEVASLRRDAIRSDAEPLVRDMLAEYEIDLPVVEDDAARLRVLVQAFEFRTFHSLFLFAVPSPVAVMERAGPAGAHAPSTAR